MRFFIFWETEKLEGNIQSEKACYNVFDIVDPVFTDVEVDSCKVHRSKTRINDDDEHEPVPETEEW